jgi:hypothetical protein
MTHFKERMSVEITAERLRYLLHYEPLTGVFRWRVSTSNRMPVGTMAGAYSRGYCILGIDGCRYRAANLAWLYMTGDWPTTGIDHKDQDSTNDRWENLRLADQSQNNANGRLRIDNVSGSRGVSWSRSKLKWRAYVSLNGKQFFCGYHDTLEAAKEARDEKAAILHGEFARFDNLSPSEGVN